MLDIELEDGKIHKKNLSFLLRLDDISNKIIEKRGKRIAGNFCLNIKHRNVNKRMNEKIWQHGTLFSLGY